MESRVLFAHVSNTVMIVFKLVHVIHLAQCRYPGSNEKHKETGGGGGGNQESGSVMLGCSCVWHERE